MTKSTQEHTTGWLMAFPGPDVRGSLFPLSGHGFVLAEPVLGFPRPGTILRRFRHYAELLQDPVAHQAFIVTLGFVLLSTALELLLGTGIALVIHERFRGRGWVRAAVLIPWAIPTVVASQMWRFLLNDQYGAVNAILFGDRVGRLRAVAGRPVDGFRRHRPSRRLENVVVYPASLSWRACKSFPRRPMTRRASMEPRHGSGSGISPSPC